MTSSQLAGYLLSLVVNIVLARLLTPDDFGTFALALSIESLFFILAGWGFSIAVIQTEKIDQTFFDTAWVLSLVLGCSVFIIVVIASFFLRSFYATEVLNIMVVLAVFEIPQSLSTCYSASLERDLNYRGVSFVLVGSQLASIALALGLAAIGLGVWSLVGKSAVYSIGSLAGMQLLSPWKFRGRFKISTIKHLLGFGSNMLLASGLARLLSMIQSFIVGTILGTAALGYFTMAIGLSQLGAIVASSALNNVSMAFFARLQTSGKQGRAYEMVNYFLVRAFLVVTIVFLLLGEEITVLLYGDKWNMAGKILRILSFYAFTYVLYGNARQLLYSQARIKEVAIIHSVQVVVTVIGMLAVLKEYGVFGAAWIVNLAFLLAMFLAFKYGGSRIDLSLMKLMLPPGLAGIATVIIFLGLRDVGFGYLHMGRFVAIVVDVGTVSILYLTILWFLERAQLRNSVRYLVSVARQKDS